MSIIIIKETSYRGWKTYAFTTGDLEVTVLPDLGGRIISLRFQGKELLFTQAEHEGETFDLASITDLAAYKKELGFRLWGGDKTWVSPQSAWVEGIPPLDLDAGHYEFEKLHNGVRMTSPICRETGLQLERSVTVIDRDSIMLAETLWNRNDHPVRRGLWDVTQILQPAVVSFPSSAASIKAYPEEGESVQLKAKYVEDHDHGVTISCIDPVKFKYGGTSYAEGEIVTYLGGDREGIVFERSYAPMGNVDYAHGCAIEVYNSADYPYLEVELHSKLNDIPPGESIMNTQVWSFYSNFSINPGKM